MRFIARGAVLIAGLVVAFVVALAGAPAASAGSDELIFTPGGEVSWSHDGDKVLVCDGRRDGLSIEGHYRFVGDTYPGHVYDAAGVGDCERATWDTYEGADIEIQLCYRDDFVITKCTNWQRAEA